MPAPSPPPHEVTQLLVAWGNGNQAALDQLMPLVYTEWRQLARRYMRRERSGHTMQTTALIYEVYLRLIDQNQVRWQHRAHFFGIAARLMRQLLIEHARRHMRAKRGVGAGTISLDETAIVARARATELLALDDALERLATIDARKSRVVELRFFGGLSVAEAAQVLHVAPNTVLRDWRLAYEQDEGFIETPAWEFAVPLFADQPLEVLTGQGIGHYTVRAVLGIGGMGEVYLAEDTRLGRKVALKLLPTLFTHDRDRLRRFEQEARTASALNHPHILTIYEIGQVDDVHFSATEFIDGETLRQRMAGQMAPIADVLTVAEQVASALAAAHAAGIVHRDIKPENIMVHHDGYVKVVAVNGDAHTFEADVPVALFDVNVGHYIPGLLAGMYQYDATADGQRFLVNTLLEEPPTPPITVVINWIAGLKR